MRCNVYRTSQDSTHFPRPDVILDKVGLVRVLIDKKSVVKIVKTATVTAVDMISNIGGILGLFCGVSFLSLAEFVYWMSKLVCRKVK